MRFPEISESTSIKNCKESLKLAMLNFDAVKAEYRPELTARMAALWDRIRELESAKKKTRKK